MRSLPSSPPLLLVFFSVGLARSHLVYPPPTDVTPTKVQLIFGLGIPMEIEASTIVGYVMKANYNLPYNSSLLTNPYVRYQRSIESRKTTATSRYDLYRMLEGSSSSSSSSSAMRQGKACLLRCICELAATPLRDDSILAQLVHVLFTPSSTRADDWIEWSDQEYRAAELLGQRHKGSGSDVCSRNFAECQISILSYFTDYYRDHYDDDDEQEESEQQQQQWKQEISD